MVFELGKWFLLGFELILCCSLKCVIEERRKRALVAYSNSRKTIFLVKKRNFKILLKVNKHRKNLSNLPQNSPCSGPDTPNIGDFDDHLESVTQTFRECQPIELNSRHLYYALSSTPSEEVGVVYDIWARKILAKNFNRGLRKKYQFMLKGQQCFCFDFEPVNHNKRYQIWTYNSKFLGGKEFHFTDKSEGNGGLERALEAKDAPGCPRERDLRFQIPPGVCRPMISPEGTYVLFVTHHSISVARFDSGERMDMVCEYRTQYFVKFEKIEFLAENLIAILMKKKEVEYIIDKFGGSLQDVWVQYFLLLELWG